MTLRSALSVALIAGAALPAICGCNGSKPAPVAKPVAKAAIPNAAPARPAPPPRPEGPKYTLIPAKPVLRPGDPGIQFLATATRSDGGVVDATDTVAWRIEPASAAVMAPGGYLRPTGGGDARVVALADGKPVAESSIHIDAPTADRPWDFAQDIVPIFTRYGCNTGGCHGKADGQNGFHLSLFGYDPEGDLRAITHEAGGRRLQPLAPEHSLLVDKATGRVPHTGGQRITPNGDAYRTLVAWIAAGAPDRRGREAGEVVQVTVEPSDARLAEPGPRRLRVVAKYKDGHERDVTKLATFRVNDDTTASVDADGKTVLLRRGEVDVVVRYRSSVVATRIATIVNPGLKYDFAKLPKSNFIDEELYKRLESLKVPPSPPAPDAVFLRRVTLDLTGQQPQPDEIKAFIADKDPAKRIKRVDDLLKSRDFWRFWQVKYGDLLQISAARFPNTSGSYIRWLQDRLERNVPWDEMVRELMTATGDPMRLDGGAVNYALDGIDAKVMAEQTAQRFLALRLRCAQCHDHPFDIWTQDDYYGLAAFFAKVDRNDPRRAMAGRAYVRVNPEGTVPHLRTGKPATPKLPGGKVVELPKDADPRKELAEWMTRADNPYFARATANWVWAQFFGRGLADPPDDLSRSNPPVHPELLDRLAESFVRSKYDLRALIRTVVVSNAYGAASEPTKDNSADHRLFSHQSVRPLTAHQMADALAQVTSVPNRFGQLGIRKAIEVNDPSTPSVILDTFGRCPRVSGCSSVATPSLSLRQSLLLIGGDVLESKVSSLNGYLAKMLELSPEPADIVENLYLRTLCRPPTAEESSHWTAELKGAANLHEAAEDLFWALLNSREFAFNH